MPRSHQDNRTLAIVCILTAVGFASTQDAVVKSMSGSYSAYETVILRCLGSAPVLAFLLWRDGSANELFPPLLPRILVRSLILCSAYFAFVLSIAAMPIANAVAIYFTMPFFVASLAGPILGETVRIHRWLAIIAGFIGVLIMTRPGAGTFEPAALLALYSAFGYAVGQMIGRPLAQQVSPAVIANWQNLAYVLVSLTLALFFNLFDFSGVEHKSLAFLSRPWVWPPMSDFLILFSIGMFAAFGMVLFIAAYKYGESNFVAPFEYSSMIWAVVYGVFLFGDFPDAYTWVGAAIVVAAGLTMIWRDRQLDRAVAATAQESA
jgi:drug/metabolite transporter (DMT)-like permease